MKKEPDLLIRFSVPCLNVDYYYSYIVFLQIVIAIYLYRISLKEFFLFLVKRETINRVRKLNGIEIIPGLLKGTGAVVGSSP